MWAWNVFASQFRSKMCMRPYESQIIIWLLPLVAHLISASCLITKCHYYIHLLIGLNDAFCMLLTSNFSFTFLPRSSLHSKSKKLNFLHWMIKWNWSNDTFSFVHIQTLIWNYSDNSHLEECHLWAGYWTGTMDSIQMLAVDKSKSKSSTLSTRTTNNPIRPKTNANDNRLSRSLRYWHLLNINYTQCFQYVLSKFDTKQP